MKALLLAGGFAKRMWPLTRNFPKPLLSVGEKRVIEYTLEKLLGVKCIDKIYISTNKRFEKKFTRFLKKVNGGKRIELVIEPSTKEEEKLGSIASMDFLIKEKHINDDLMVIGGDNIFSFDVNRLISFFKKKNASVNAVFNIKKKSVAKLKYGVVEMNTSNRITRFEEKPRVPKSTHVSTACYIFKKDDLKFISQYLKENGNRDAMGFFLSWLIERVPVYGFKFRGIWFDIGSFETLKEARNYFYKKR